jgi:hypothetical protein
MKNALLITAAVVALAGCQKAATNSENAAASAASNAAEPAPAAAPAAMVTANGSTPGTFEVTSKDGKGTTVLNADGTYSDTDPKGKETKGTWNVTGGKTCFDPEGSEGPACYTESAVGADGSFAATSDKGEKVTVKKVS